MRKARAILVVLLSSLCWAQGVRGESSEHSEHPLLTADLIPFSYSLRPNPRYIGGKPYIGGKFADMGVIFRSPDELLCYFVTRQSVGQLGQRDKLEISGAYQLHLIFLATGGAAVRSHKVLPARAGVTSVTVNPEGRFVVRTGDFLTLYSTDLTIYRERALPSAWLRAWTVRNSPTGEKLGLRYSSYPLEQFEILDSRSLSTTVGPQNDHLLPYFSISDTGIVQLARDHKSLLFRDFTGGWQRLATSISLSCISNNPVFMNDNLLLNACGQHLVMFKTSGDVLMDDRIDKGEYLEELASVTPDGRFFAVSAMRTKGGFMDFTSVKRSHTRILVYDAVSRRRIFTVKVNPIPKNDYDFAIAPDGGKLAVLTDNKVAVFAIRPD